MQRRALAAQGTIPNERLPTAQKQIAEGSASAGIVGTDESNVLQDDWSEITEESPVDQMHDFPGTRQMHAWGRSGRLEDAFRDKVHVVTVESYQWLLLPLQVIRS